MQRAYCSIFITSNAGNLRESCSDHLLTSTVDCAPAGAGELTDIGNRALKYKRHDAYSEGKCVTYGIHKMCCSGVNL